MHLDKLQIASARLGDAIYGFFSGNHPSTTIDNCRDVSDILKGVKHYMQKKEQAHTPFLEYEENDEITARFRKLANFSKHAQKDANRLANTDEKTAYLALQDTICDYRTIITSFTESGVIDTYESEEYIDDWKITEEFGTGNRVTLLCNLFDTWDTQNYGMNLAEESSHIALQLYDEMQKNHVLHVSPETTNDKKMQSLLQQMGDVMNKQREQKGDNNTLKTKREWRNKIEELNLWPIPHHGGIKLARNGEINFSPINESYTPET